MVAQALQSEKLVTMSDNILVYYSETRANVGIIKGTDRIALIDTGHNGDHIHAILTSLQTDHVDYAILTHYHMDHTLGLAYLDCLSIGHMNIRINIENYRNQDWSDDGIRKQIEDGLLPPVMLNWFQKNYPNRSKVKYKVPNLLFDKKIELDLGNQTVELTRIDTQHTNDSIIVYVPNEESLFLGDCLSPSSKGIITPKYMNRLLDELLSYDNKIMIEGHGPPLGNGTGNDYLRELMEISNFIETHGTQAKEKLDLISSKCQIFDHESISSYMPFFIKGILESN